MKHFLTSLAGTVVTTDFGDMLVGGTGGDTLTMNATLFGLAGMAGNDTLNGGTGNDFLFGDYFSADLFSDTLTGPPSYDFTVVGNDKLYGGAGGDTLIGGPGSDVMSGGSGNDWYALQGGGVDKIIELARGGKDTVQTSDTFYTLGKNLENLVFGALLDEFRKNVHGIGNAAGNFITGSLGDDTLDGLDGNDSLCGSGGGDRLTGGAGADAFAFGFGNTQNGILSIGAKADTIVDFSAGEDRFLLDSFSFTFRPVGTGQLKAGQFGIVGDVLTGRELVLYDQDSGNLSTPSGDVFAHVTPGTVLSYHDFSWYSF